MKILIIGVTGMLGYSLFSKLRENKSFQVKGTVRNIFGKEHFFSDCFDSLIQGVDVSNIRHVEASISGFKPDVVINCVGLIKQYDLSKQYIATIKINSLLPHEIAAICDRHNARLIHFSTDCVFDGKTGNYRETDTPNASDLYGRSKALGEISYGKHLTLRTSIIGHELTSSVSLVDWFLSQSGRVNGFSMAVFSGLPTCYVAKILEERILFNPDLKGLYHLAVSPIDKFSLLSLIADIYGKEITINRSEALTIDRSLDASKFCNDTGFEPPTWNSLIHYMHQDYKKRYNA
ncbi:dTDP-4-dehydrorhamnose reductase family protein [Grimontia hollisae]|nr:SDR family oxidoreductase [Grimontia hollisae]